MSESKLSMLTTGLHHGTTLYLVNSQLQITGSWPTDKLAEQSSSVTSKKSLNVYKSCPKMISLEKIKDFDTFTKIA